MRKTIRLFYISLFILTGCTKGIKIPSPQESLDKAIRYYNEGKYQKVLDLLQNQISSYIYTSRGDEAEYYLAMSYFKLKEYEDAIVEFEFIIDYYNYSSYREKAYYFLALSYYKNSPTIERDQSDLNKALTIISEFESEYPTSTFTSKMEMLKEDILNKLSLKMIDIIKTYYNLGKFTSALLYIKSLRKEYPGTIGDNLTYLFEALIKKEEGEEYKKFLSKLNPDLIPGKFKKYYKKLVTQH